MKEGSYIQYFILIIQLISVVFLASCSDTESEDLSEEPIEEVPFYVVDRNASGPLTLAELQLNIPREIDADLTESKRSCFFDSVEKRAFEAGDPAILDPEDFPYWNGKISRDDWGQQSNYMKRVLLAQAIISWAMVEC
jgi:hypothetical protein